MSEADKNIIEGYCIQEENPTPDNPIEIKTLKTPFKNEIPSYKSADEMFEELGYDILVDNEECLQYERTGLYMDLEIKFDKEGKTILKEYSDGESCEITMQEFKAINEKVKELDWYE